MQSSRIQYFDPKSKSQSKVSQTFMIQLKLFKVKFFFPVADVLANLTGKLTGEVNKF